ncbi:MAG: hypothetical protein WCT03_15325, partial [Candidatus Obscuribacterales bacterium]
MSNPDIQTVAQFGSVIVEICGAVNGISALLGAVIVSINHYHGYTNKLLLIGVASLTCAAVVPPLINLLLPSHDLAAAALGLSAALPLAIGGFWGFFLPMRIVFQGNRVGAKGVCIANLLFFIPFSWHLALWIATIPKVTRQLSKLVWGDNCPVELISVREHTDQLLVMLKQVGASKATARITKSLDKHVTSDVLLKNYEEALGRLMFD